MSVMALGAEKNGYPALTSPKFEPFSTNINSRYMVLITNFVFNFD